MFWHKFHVCSAVCVPYFLLLTHTHTHKLTHTTGVRNRKRDPLITHLTPGTSEPREGQMVDADWELMHAHFFMYPSLWKRTVSCRRVEKQSVTLSAYIFFNCMCSSKGIFYRTLSACIFLEFLQCPEICCTDAISRVRFHPFCFVPGWPLSKQVADCGMSTKTLSVQSHG